MYPADPVAPVQHEDVRALSEAEWLDRLLRSVDEPVVENRLYPRFPDVGLQRAFVGSDSAAAIREAFNFYSYIHTHLKGRRFKVRADRYLDFGSGWGRITRTFLRDFPRGEMVGVDVDQDMVSFCHFAGVPGAHFQVEPHGRLPFADESFKLITAYSVFSHLPKTLFHHWMNELLRVAAPGALIAFTVEPERFLDFVAGLDLEADSDWHRALAGSFGELKARRDELHREGITFIPTGGGPYRPKVSYGDTVVTEDFLRGCVAGKGEILAWVDEPEKFWQAVVVVRKHRWRSPLRRLVGR